MSVIAVYNMKGGVGKTTTAINLSYLCAAAGQRTLLWDLDPQAASSFAFRIRPHVEGFKKNGVERGHVFAEAIKQTDYDGLDVLPADFAYRKLDRLLGRLGKPERVVGGILAELARGYDAVLLDCPPGWSLVTEGVFASADIVLVPTIPTVLSLRTLSQLIAWTGRGDRTPAVVAFLNMVDRRKALHQRTCDWSTRHPELFLSGQIGYSSLVEQMAVRREPLPVFAPDDAASAAFQSIRTEVLTRLPQAGHRDAALAHPRCWCGRSSRSSPGSRAPSRTRRYGRPLRSRRGRQGSCRWFTGSTPTIATSSVRGTCSSSTKRPGSSALWSRHRTDRTMTARTRRPRVPGLRSTRDGRPRFCQGCDRRSTRSNADRASRCRRWSATCAPSSGSGRCSGSTPAWQSGITCRLLRVARS